MTPADQQWLSSTAHQNSQMKSDILAYLTGKEWGLGNGQCPECCGKKPRKGWWTETIGHSRNCPLAHAIIEAGGKVTWEMANRSKARAAALSGEAKIIAAALKVHESN